MGLGVDQAAHAAPTVAERAMAATAHASAWLGFPFLIPAGTWLLATLGGWSRYVRAQSAQVLAFQGAVAIAVAALLALAALFGLIDLIAQVGGELIQAIGTVIAAPFLLIWMILGDPKPLMKLASGAAPAPWPWQWHIALALVALAGLVLIGAAVLALVGTVATLMGRSFRYPIMGRAMAARQERLE
jgi:uncharacterized Tic20 family protein